MRAPRFALASSLAIALSLSASAAWAVTLTVGPGRMYATPSAASAAAHDGDTVEIAAGTYRDITIWRAQNLTIRGVGGFAHLDAAGLTIPNGKAIWVIQGRGYTLDHIEFSGARVPDRNGAGIRQEAPGLTVRNCSFHDNENGILTGADATSDIVIEASEFNHNGAGDGQSHNMYIGAVRSFTLRGCYTHDAVIGHLVKSRAAANYILYNRITGEGGTDSYEINLPNGGVAVIVGNIIQQGPATDNSTIVSFAEEGATHPTQRFFMVNNTLVNNRSAGLFVRIAGAPSPSVLTNNLFVGPGTQLTGTATATRSVTGMASWFASATTYDYRLTAAATGAIDQGVDPGPMPAGVTESLAPLLQYVHPNATMTRTTAGAALDLGAYEFSATMSDAGAADVPRDVVSDVPRDVASDVVSDVASDAPRDVVSDVAVDAVSDVVVRDVVVSDVATDGGSSDPPLRDAGEESSEFVPDGGAPDVATVDAETSDVSVADASITDVMSDAASGAAVDGGAAATPDAGCGCATVGASKPSWGALVFAALLVARRRRRVG